jgi:hypothetical protein
MKRLILVLGLLISLSACANGPRPPKLPYPAWSVALAAPKHMEVWVESVDVLDQRRLGFFHVFGGVASYTEKSGAGTKVVGKPCLSATWICPKKST